MAALEQYRAKRDFSRTSEPSGRARATKSKSTGGKFVVHKHDATRLHYDLRLEHEGVLWSWAVTRGPSLDPAEKRLAVHVEDHPLDYSSFEGNIPKGEYGGGAVIVWDEGKWAPEGDPAAGMKKGHIRFILHGQKLHGAWHLVRLKPRPREKRDNWLLIKSDDEFARPDEDILAEAPESVKSGLTIEDIAEGRTAGRKPARKAKPAAKVAKPASRGRSKAITFIEPCLATLHAKPPPGYEWLHEVKFDGYRLQAQVSDRKARLLTRKALDWTERFGAAIADALGGLDCEDAIIDGEVVVLSDKGVSSFSALQNALSERRTERMIFYAFDLMRLDGEDLTGKPLIERKQMLRDLIAEADGPLRYSEHFAEPGGAMLRHACRMGLEGVISKLADSPYRSGRGGDWIKSKCTLRQEFIIVGYLPSQKTGRNLRSLVVGYREGGEIRTAGHVGTGFSGPELTELKRKLDALKTKESPLKGKEGRKKGVVWVRPELVAEVEFRSWTADRILRQASFLGLREDKTSEEIVAERPEEDDTSPTTKRRRTQASRGPGKKAETEVTLTNPDKLLWPDAGITKKDLRDYYSRVWPRMERFVVNRPLSLVRAPDGVGGQRFFQKHASPGMHEKISRANDPEDGEELLFIKDFDGLAALVQLGVVEVHLWGCTIDALDTPDSIVFDLDPDEGVDAARVREATLDVKTRLDDLGLPNLLKVSGGKGFHVVVPLKPKADWGTVKGFAHDFARAMEQSDPDRYTATLSKKARKGRIFIDYLRNGRGSTTVAPWSSRGKPQATVSVPVSWKQLEDGLGPADYTIDNDATDKALAQPDAWADFERLRKVLKG